MAISRATQSCLHFAKVEALGNDFVWLLDSADEAVVREIGPGTFWICDRHKGVGGDGLVLWDGVVPDPTLWFLNADGSPAEVCGNGLRAVAVAGRDLGLFQPGPASFRSAEASFPVEIGTLGSSTAVGLGVPRFAESVAVDEALRSSGASGAMVYMPNSHVVVFGGPVAQDQREAMAAGLASRVNGGANVGFCSVQGDGIDLEVVERGAGWTKACGSGAAAAAASARRLGLIAAEEVYVRQPGGILRTWCDREGRVWIEGDAALVFVGLLPRKTQADGCHAAWNSLAQDFGLTASTSRWRLS